MEGPKAYQYIPLQSPRAIRLLQVQPAASESSPLLCRLVEVSLDKPPEYDALSYTWGKPSAIGPNTVDCNDGYLPITKNCHDALTRLRHKRKPTRLWVDALCIDQSCVAERSSQVTMMGEIYKSAARVVVWLGPGDPESDFVFAVMRRLGKLSCFALPFQRSPQIGADKNRKISNLIEDLVKKNSEGPRWADRHRHFLAFHKRPYWTRMWTIQEFAANKATVLYCGAAEPVSAFFLYALSSTFISGDMLLQSTFATMRKSFRLHHECVFREQQQAPLSKLLLQILSMQASEPRDKIYALRSVFSEIFGPMKVDYDAPVSNVYNETTARIITHDQSLEILKEAGRDGSWGVASWAVDWGSDFSESLASGVPEWDCSRASGGVSRSGGDYKNLSVKGHIFDKIVVVSSAKIYLTRPLGMVPEEQLEKGKVGEYTPDFSATKPFFRAVAQFLWDVHASQGRTGLHLPRKFQDLLALLLGSHYNFESGGIPKKFLEPLFALLFHERESFAPANLEPVANETEKQLLEVFEESRSPVPQLLVPDESLKLFLWRDTSKVGMEILFYTKKGRIGVSNSRVQTGDVGAGLSGLGNPFTLRASGPDRFKLIGQGIMTGVMNGEEWPESEEGLRWLHLV